MCTFCEELEIYYYGDDIKELYNEDFTFSFVGRAENSKYIEKCVTIKNREGVLFYPTIETKWLLWKCGTFESIQITHCPQCGRELD